MHPLGSTHKSIGLASSIFLYLAGQVVPAFSTRYFTQGHLNNEHSTNSSFEYPVALSGPSCLHIPSLAYLISEYVLIVSVKFVAHCEYCILQLEPHAMSTVRKGGLQASQGSAANRIFVIQSLLRTRCTYQHLRPAVYK